MSKKSPFSRDRIAIYLVIIILIGLFFTKNSIDFQALSLLTINKKLILGIFFALAMLVLRDIGYVWRLRLLTDYKISFFKTLRIILLWEFGSAITPGMIGGKAVAIYLLVKEKVNAAKASSVVLLAILLDEFVFILLFPVLYAIVGRKMLHGSTDCPDWQELVRQMPIVENVKYLEYTIVIMLVLVMTFVVVSFIGIFIYPSWIQNNLIRLAKKKLFSRWKEKIENFGNDLYQTSIKFKKKKKRFWMKLMFFTALSWIGRYLVGVSIVWALSGNNFDFLMVYARQYALWLMFYLPSTPGSSGIAESLFMAFYCEYIIQGLSGSAALLWRLMSYYIYLVIGVIFVFVRGKDVGIDD